jgi:hypothetical protein
MIFRWFAFLCLLFSWGPLHQSGVNPGRRVDPEMFYHNQIQKIVLLDGTPPYFEQPAKTEIWTWDGKKWELADSAKGPVGRYTSSSSYDSRRNVIVSFGGRVGKAEKIQNDVWEWNGVTWSEATDAKMPARDHHMMCYDDQRGKTVLFGGGIFPRVAGPWAKDTWEWNGKTWEQVSTDGPPGRVSTMVYDNEHKQVVLFGGVGAPENGVQPKYDDTWSWNGTQWKKLSDQGPAGRSRHAMVYDKRRKKIILYGGENENGDLGDMWEWDGTKWSEIKMDSPNPGTRYVHAMAYDETRGVTILYGGMHNKVLMTDTWEWDGKWRKID